jgi:hypothetical protein
MLFQNNDNASWQKCQQSENWNLPTYVQVKCPFMHHHIKNLIQFFLITMEHITQISILGVIVPIVQICLALFHNSNKITCKTFLRLEKFDQFIFPFKHGHDLRMAPHYFQVAKKL